MSTKSDTSSAPASSLLFTDTEAPAPAPVGTPAVSDAEAEAERKARRNFRDRERKRRERAERGGKLSVNGKRIGRPPGATNKPKEEGAPKLEEPKKEEGKGNGFNAELDALRAAYSQEAERPPAADPLGAPMPDAKPFISGYVLLLVVDVLFPMLTGAIMRRDPSKLRLTKEERDQLEPIADRAAMDLLGGLSPVQLFLSVTFAMFLGKATALPKLPKKERDTNGAK